MSTSDAVVVECFGRRAIVQLATGERRDSVVFGKRLSVVCGDRVKIGAHEGSDETQIVEVLKRHREFNRTDSRGRMETLAANVTMLAVVLAPEPKPDLYIVDRYLAGAEYAGLRSVVILNKMDVSDSATDYLAEYKAAGYDTFSVSASSGRNLEQLRVRIATDSFLLAGQSGVGKSTLSNALLPELMRPTRELSTGSGEGKHTTVSSALFYLPEGGSLIDSPGVRDFAPPPLADDKVQVGWPEILALAPSCRFNDCLHLREPGCAVLASLEQKIISARRYESYKRMLNIMRGLLPSHERK